MSPIDILLKLHGDENLEWTWQCEPSRQPVFMVLDGVIATPVNLRDYPQFYEELPNKVFQFTAAARKRYLALPREFGL